MGRALRGSIPGPWDAEVKSEGLTFIDFQTFDFETFRLSTLKPSPIHAGTAWERYQPSDSSSPASIPWLG